MRHFASQAKLKTKRAHVICILIWDMAIVEALKKTVEVCWYFSTFLEVRYHEQMREHMGEHEAHGTDNLTSNKTKLD